MLADGGFEVAFHGEYREIVPNERIVSTEVYEGMPEAESLNTVTFTEVDGRTTLTVLVQHQTKKHLDAHINSGPHVVAFRYWRRRGARRFRSEDKSETHALESHREAGAEAAGGRRRFVGLHNSRSW